MILPAEPRRRLWLVRAGCVAAGSVFLAAGFLLPDELTPPTGNNVFYSAMLVTGFTLVAWGITQLVRLVWLKSLVFITAAAFYWAVIVWIVYGSVQLMPTGINALTSGWPTWHVLLMLPVAIWVAAQLVWGRSMDDALEDLELAGEGGAAKNGKGEDTSANDRNAVDTAHREPVPPEDEADKLRAHAGGFGSHSEGF